MNILVIGYKGEPASAWSCLYLTKMLNDLGFGIKAQAFWLTGDEIVEGELSPALDSQDFDMAISINIPRFCYGSEVARIPVMVTWVQDWCTWMTKENMELWNSSISLYNDWMIGYIHNLPGLRMDRAIECPFILPRQSLRHKPSRDVVAPMNKGEGWIKWWKHMQCPDVLKGMGIDSRLTYLALARMDVDIGRGVLTPKSGMEELLAMIPDTDKMDYGFKCITMTYSMISSMFRCRAASLLLDGQIAGHHIFKAAGNGWSEDIGIGYLSPQHVQEFMTTGRYVLHVSPVLNNHHRTSMAFLSGRMPLVLSDHDSCGAYGNPDAYMTMQTEFLLDIVTCLPTNDPVRAFPISSTDILGKPANIAMTSLHNIKDWEWRVLG